MYLVSQYIYIHTDEVMGFTVSQVSIELVKHYSFTGQSSFLSGEGESLHNIWDIDQSNPAAANREEDRAIGQWK